MLGKKTMEVEILREAVEYGRAKKVYGPPRRCKRAFSDETVCVNVSGLSRVSRFWRPMMGYARSVPNKWTDLKGRFFVPGLPNAGALFRHQLHVCKP
ncbi:hypothetical protein LMG24076_01562 [Trinickia soli]|nr:hypothetical protein LMG24076_01562 [Trinickia soli]